MKNREPLDYRPERVGADSQTLSRDLHESTAGYAPDHFDMRAAALDLGGADVCMSPTQIARALQVFAERAR